MAKEVVGQLPAEMVAQLPTPHVVGVVGQLPTQAVAQLPTECEGLQSLQGSSRQRRKQRWSEAKVKQQLGALVDHLLQGFV